MKKIILITLSVVFVLTFLLPQSHSTQAATSFKDVSSNHWAKSEISYLVSLGVINGYSNGKFGINDKVTNAQAAVMIVRALQLHTNDRPNPNISDVSPMHPHFKEIAAVIDEGIFPKALTFNPDAPMTREAMARAVANAFQLQANKTYSFWDVAKDDWANSYINKLAANHITVGYEDGSFKPKDTLTRAQFASFMARALNDTFKTTLIADQQLKAVKNQKVSGYQFHEAYSVKLTGNEMPEIVVSSYGFEAGTDYIDKSLLQVYQYNRSQKSWSVIQAFSDQSEYAYRPLSYITKGKLIDDKKEQLVVGYRWGSDFALTPIVYGSTDGKTIKALITTGDEAYTDGNAIIKENQLYFVESLSFVAQRYVYQNGQFVKYKGTGKDDHKLAKAAKYKVIAEMKNGSPFLTGNNAYTMKVGERFSIVRKNESDSKFYHLRFFTNLKGGPLQVNEGVLKAVKPGKITINMQLDYEANKTITFTVIK